MAKGKGKSLKHALTKHLTAEGEKQRRKAYEERQRELEKQKKQPKSKANKSRLVDTKGDGVKVPLPVPSSTTKPSYQPYHNGQRVLLVGEGNFSFALAFAKKFPASAKVSIATAYDSEEDAKRKYSDTEANVKELQERGMTVLFGVDGQNLPKTKIMKKFSTTESLRFDHVAFYFPHVGLGEKDEQRNIKLNQILLLRFLRSVQPFLKEKSTIPQLGDLNTEVEDDNLHNGEEDMNSDPESLGDDDDGGPVLDPLKATPGSVLITLFTSKPYSLWSLPALAKNPDIAAALLPFPESKTPQPRYKVDRSFAFVQKEWPGYDHRRTIGERKGQESLLDRVHSEARTWQLLPVEPKTAED